MMKDSEKAKEAISKGKVRLLSKKPFHGYIACHLKQREVDSMPTMATDGVHLYYNPTFTADLSKPQIEGALEHEVLHVYLKHLIRVYGLVPCVDLHYTDREPDPHDNCTWEIAQVAMDMAINPRMKDGGVDLIDGAVYPPKEHWDESFEQHYKRLVSEAKKSGRKKVHYTCGGGCSGAKPMPGRDGKSKPTPAERTAADAEMQTLIMNAASFARAAGKLPADIERMIQDLRAPKVAWYDVLRRFMQSTAKNDYRMTPPNRRFVHQNLYLPSLRSEAVGRVALFLDGSGSTWHVFPQFMAEYASILLEVQPEVLDVIVWDTRPTWWRSYDNFSDETGQTIMEQMPRMGAGGGSVFTEMFTWYKEQFQADPQIAICLTDMEIYWPEAPDYPVMWVATTDIQGPFGETVRIDVDE